MNKIDTYTEIYNESTEQKSVKNFNTYNNSINDESLISAVSNWVYQPSIITSNTYTINTTSTGYYPIKSLEEIVEEQNIKIKKLEKQFDLFLKFMVMKELIKDETEFNKFLDSVKVMNKLCDEDENND